ncbi:hypothetical protein [Sinorhizobium sp. BJ1]|uniref:hypothetical protein n=1 Tax=Sinorhizobium sp. BJ1 TaxID=2035455 RepID=UPI001AEC946C|nr:hypothetical protein [Sinorhizobium sp. BJ1]
MKTGNDLKEILKQTTHVYHNNACCETDKVGFATPENRPIEELVVDATQGFIPLWDRNVILNWRFQEQSLQRFAKPEAVKAYVRTLFGETPIKWGNAVPVQFSETAEPWDFEIVVRADDNCSSFWLHARESILSGCGAT